MLYYAMRDNSRLLAEAKNKMFIFIVLHQRIQNKTC